MMVGIVFEYANLQWLANIYAIMTIIVRVVVTRSELDARAQLLRRFLLSWSAIVVCAEDDALRIVFIVLAIVALIYLFIMLSTSADKFFSLNIAAIVDEHQISDTTAVSARFCAQPAHFFPRLQAPF